MATRSTIEWTEVTWNPVTGCTKISHGCKFCYAERMAKRLHAMGMPKYKDGFSVAVHETALTEPLNWRKPRLVFVNSMSDLFHRSVPTDFIEAVFDVMIGQPSILSKCSRSVRVGQPCLKDDSAGLQTSGSVPVLSPPSGWAAWPTSDVRVLRQSSCPLNLCSVHCPTWNFAGLTG